MISADEVWRVTLPTVATRRRSSTDGTRPDTPTKKPRSRRLTM
ncbi:MAG: hypothetical protein M5U30_13850 [Burkholderiaceae bacterium]|nr:hypothetical protein [Burkholderiaceae bacterium]